MRNTLNSLNTMDSVLKTEQTRKARNEFRTLYKSKLKSKKTYYNKKAIENSNNKNKAMWKT